MAARLKKIYHDKLVPELKTKLEGVNGEKEAAVRDQNFERAASLRDRERELQGDIRRKQEEWEKHRQSHRPVLGEEEVSFIVSRWTGIPVMRLQEAETARLLRMEEELHVSVVAQEEAIKALSRSIRRSRAGLKDPNRPIGSFIFMGPTGVGKTELARALAEFLFDDENAMVRIDMSEYMERHAVARLIGAPPGYIGYEEGGQLTEAIRRRPYAVVLFDEIEKAHPEVFNVMLQILDDGRLTDSKGRVVNFKNTVIIMTSNIAEEDLPKRFRPEFLNRIDDIIVFHSLNLPQIKRIVEIQLKRLSKLLADRGLTIEISDAAKEHIAREGYDPAFGARPLKRALQREVIDPLAMKLLEGKFHAGDIVFVNFRDGKLELSLEPEPTMVH